MTCQISKRFFKRKNILVVSLLVLLMFTLVACKDDVQNNQENQSESQTQAVESLPESKLNTQITPINSIVEITDVAAIDAILNDKTNLGELEKNSSHKGAYLITKHDNELKSVPIEYPFANWLSEQDKPVLVEFIADYSVPAQESLPFLYAIADKYSGQIIVAKVDITEAPDLIDIFQLKYLPTYFVSKDLTLYQVGASFDPYANPSLIDNIEQVINSK